MKPSTILLLALTGVVVVGAWKVSTSNAPTVDLAADTLYPELIEQVNAVSKVTIKSSDAVTQLVRNGETWVIGNRDNFPAKFEDVKKTILKVAEISVVEKKTADPEKYAILGVNDPSAGDAAGVRIDIEGENAASLTALIIGKARAGKALGAANYYIRRVDDEASYLVEGDLGISAQIDDWLDSDIVNIDTARVQRVIIKPEPNEEITIEKTAKTDNFFVVKDIPEGFKAKSRANVSSIGALLLSVRFEDVAAFSNVANSSPRGTIEVQTFDGLITTVRRYDYQDAEYVKFDFAYDENLVVADTADEATEASAEAAAEKPSVAEQAAQLNAKTANWIYTLPDFKTRMLSKRKGDLITPIEPESASDTSTAE